MNRYGTIAGACSVWRDEFFEMKLTLKTQSKMHI